MSSLSAEYVRFGLGGGLGVEQIAETVRDRIADHLTYNLAHKFQEQLGQLLGA